MKTKCNRCFRSMVLLLLFVSCSSGAPEDPGRLILSIASAPTEGTTLEGLEGVILNVEQIEVILRSVKDDPSTERRVPLPTEQRPINLLGLDQNVPRLIGIYQIEPGYLMQMRFVSKDATIVFKQDEPAEVSPSISLSLNVPSGEQTGIKVVPLNEEPIQIVDQQTVFWEIQFDPNQQIILNKGQGYKMKPVLAAVLKEEKTFSPIVPNQILVNFREGVTKEEIDALNAKIGTTVIGSYDPLNLYLLEFSGLAFEDVASAYQANLLVAQQEPSIILTPAQVQQVIPNDPNFSNQWALHNTGQTGGTADADIDAPEAWATETGDPAIIIAVLDTGAQLDHPDLAENIFINPGELPPNVVLDANGDGFITFSDLNAPANAGVVLDGNNNGFVDGEDVRAGAITGGLADGVDDDNNGHVDDLAGMNFAPLVSGGLPTNDPSDDSVGIFESHGTSVSGIIGALGQNSRNMSGLNWRVRLLPIKVCTAAGNCAGINIRAGVRYAVQMGTHVANLSLGATLINDPNGQAFLNNFATFLNSINAQNMLLVVSAGNDAADCDKGTVVCYLAEVNVNHLLGVAATTDQDNLASSFSNYGDTTIPIAAPGRNILTLNRFSGIKTTSGTSFAAPQVAGVAGLSLARFPALIGNPVGVITRLQNGADSVGSLTNVVVQGRRVNARGALQ